MRILFYFILSYLFTGCGKDNTSSTDLTGMNVENKGFNLQNQESIEILSNLEYMSIKELHILLNDRFFKNKYLLNVNKYYESKKIDIYTVKLKNNNLPNNIKKNYVVVDIKEKQLQYILPIEISQMFSIDKTIMFGGIYNYREYEYYSIYKIQNGMIINELNSRDIKGKSIIIGYYKDDECIDYRQDRLKFYYNSQKREILFKGMIDNYCLEGFDRFSNSIVKKKYEAKVYFTYTKSKWIYETSKSEYYFW